MSCSDKVKMLHSKFEIEKTNSNGFFRKNKQQEEDILFDKQIESFIKTPTQQRTCSRSKTGSKTKNPAKNIWTSFTTFCCSNIYDHHIQMINQNIEFKFQQPSQKLKLESNCFTKRNKMIDEIKRIKTENPSFPTRILIEAASSPILSQIFRLFIFEAAQYWIMKHSNIDEKHRYKYANAVKCVKKYLETGKDLTFLNEVIEAPFVPPPLPFVFNFSKETEKIVSSTPNSSPSSQNLNKIEPFSVSTSLQKQKSFVTEISQKKIIQNQSKISKRSNTSSQKFLSQSKINQFSSSESEQDSLFDSEYAFVLDDSIDSNLFIGEFHGVESQDSMLKNFSRSKQYNYPQPYALYQEEKNLQKS